MESCVYGWLSGLPGNLFYSRVVREHLEGEGLVVVGRHTGDEAGEAAELDEEVVLFSGAEVICCQGAAYREGGEGVLESGIEEEVAVSVVPDERFKVPYLVEAVLAVVFGHSFL